MEMKFKKKSTILLFNKIRIDLYDHINFAILPMKLYERLYRGNYYQSKESVQKNTVGWTAQNMGK